MNCTSEMPESVKTFQITVFSLVFIIGVILHAIALRTFCWKLRKWTETTIYMTNLAISDCIVLVTLPFKIYSYYNKVEKTILCKLVLMLRHINMCISILTITYINVDRYIAIVHPFKAKMLRSPMKAALASAGTWIFGSSWIIPIILQINMGNAENISETELKTTCFNFALKNYWSYYIIVVIVLFLALPLIVVIFCSLQIIRILQKRRISNTPAFSTKRTIQIIAASAVVFVGCFMPHNIVSIANYALISMNANCHIQNQVYLFMQVTWCIANINCCLDGFCYYFVTADTVEFDRNQAAIKESRQRSNYHFESS